MEPEQPNLAERFLELVEQDNVLAMRELLNDQNISDVAELINEHPEYEGQIIMNMSVHRASSVFKILDLSQQKTIIQELPALKTAELLNELPANCEYEMDYERRVISIKTIRFVKAGEELFLNYNGSWNDEKKVWFDKG